jgi:arginyl-tRNA synthetase
MRTFHGWSKLPELVGGLYSTISGRVQHVTFGEVMGMSTRKGNVKFPDDILDECGTFMHGVIQGNQANYVQVHEPEKNPDLLEISAVMVQDMLREKLNNYLFGMSRMTSFEGDTGPYFQYAHARLFSVGRRAGFSGDQIRTADTPMLEEPQAVTLLRILAQYPDMVTHALKTLEPSTIPTICSVWPIISLRAKTC